jgi:hypothetical protein
MRSSPKTTTHRNSRLYENSEVSDLSAVDIIEQELYGRGSGSSNARSRETSSGSSARKKNGKDRGSRSQASGSSRKSKASRSQRDSSSSDDCSEDVITEKSRQSPRASPKPTARSKPHRVMNKKHDKEDDYKSRRLSRVQKSETSDTDDENFLDERYFP